MARGVRTGGVFAHVHGISPVLRSHNVFWGGFGSGASLASWWAVLKRYIIVYFKASGVALFVKTMQWRSEIEV